MKTINQTTIPVSIAGLLFPLKKQVNIKAAAPPVTSISTVQQIMICLEVKIEI